MSVNSYTVDNTKHIKAKVALDKLPPVCNDQNVHLRHPAMMQTISVWQSLLGLEFYAQADAVLEVGKAVFGEVYFMAAISEMLRPGPGAVRVKQEAP